MSPKYIRVPVTRIFIIWVVLSNNIALFLNEYYCLN
jgi:hypothetical protein